MNLGAVGKKGEDMVASFLRKNGHTIIYTLPSDAFSERPRSLMEPPHFVASLTSIPVIFLIPSVVMQSGEIFLP